MIVNSISSVKSRQNSPQNNSRTNFKSVMGTINKPDQLASVLKTATQIYPRDTIVLGHSIPPVVLCCTTGNRNFDEEIARQLTNAFRRNGKANDFRVIGRAEADRLKDQNRKAEGVLTTVEQRRINLNKSNADYVAGLTK